jgi:hypothetical protein
MVITENDLDEIHVRLALNRHPVHDHAQERADRVLEELSS